MSEPLACLTPAPEPEGTDTGPRLLLLSDLLTEAEADARALYDAKQAGVARGPVSNLRRLDREIGGFFATGVHILHGTPGAGKTALALQVAASCACPALYITLEMRPLVLLKRLAARVTSTYLGRFSTGELAPDQAAALYHRAIAETPNLAILDATSKPANGATIYRAAEAARRLVSESPHLLVVLDSLHSYADTLPGDAATEYDRLNAALSLMRNLAARLACPVLTVCERNRASMAKGGLSAGAGTRKIEYGAETVLDMDVDAEEEKDRNGEKVITLRIAKNRNGTAGKEIHLLFNGALQQFREDAQ